MPIGLENLDKSLISMKKIIKPLPVKALYNIAKLAKLKSLEHFHTPPLW